MKKTILLALMLSAFISCKNESKTSTETISVDGLEKTAKSCHANTLSLVDALSSISGVKKIFSSPLFHEAVIQLNKPVTDVIKQLASANIAGGYKLEKDHPELENCMLVCATEKRTAEDINHFKNTLDNILN